MAPLGALGAWCVVGWFGALLTRTLSVRVERLAVPRRPKRLQGCFGFGGIDQPRLQAEAMRCQRGADAVANIKTEVLSTFGEALPVVGARDPSEHVKVSGLSRRHEH